MRSQTFAFHRETDDWGKPLGVAVARTSSVTDSTNSGCFWRGGSPKMVIAYVDIPGRIAQAYLPLYMLDRGRELGDGVQLFVEELRAKQVVGEWRGEVLVASATTIWKIGRDFCVTLMNEPFGVIGDFAEELAKEIRSTRDSCSTLNRMNAQLCLVQSLTAFKNARQETGVWRISSELYIL